MSVLRLSSLLSTFVRCFVPPVPSHLFVYPFACASAPPPPPVYARRSPGYDLPEVHQIRRKSKEASTSSQLQFHLPSLVTSEQTPYGTSSPCHLCDHLIRYASHCPFPISNWVTPRPLIPLFVVALPYAHLVTAVQFLRCAIAQSPHDPRRPSCHGPRCLTLAASPSSHCPHGQSPQHVWLSASGRPAKIPFFAVPLAFLSMLVGNMAARLMAKAADWYESLGNLLGAARCV